MEPLPIACTLSPADLEERKATTLDQLFASAQEVVPLNSGYRFRFDPSDQKLYTIFEMIAKERKCCRFMDFELQVTAAEGPIWLVVKGPEGTKQFLESLLDMENS